jgi:hypothetical protein
MKCSWSGTVRALPVLVVPASGEILMGGIGFANFCKRCSKANSTAQLRGRVMLVERSRWAATRREQ